MKRADSSETPGEKLLMRSIPVFFGSCLLFLSAAGVKDTYEFRHEAATVTGEVLEVILDQDYRTTNYPHHEDFYWVRVSFSEAGALRIAKLKATPEEAAAIHPGQRLAFLHAARSGRVRLGEPPGWALSLVWCAFAVPLGLALVYRGLRGPVPPFKK